MKIKMISDTFLSELEKEVNEYLEKLSGYSPIDVKINEYRSGYLATIILEEKPHSTALPRGEGR